MAQIICAAKYSVNLFNAHDKMLVAEASDFGPAGAWHVGIFSRIYADACDIGLTMIGKTGKEATFYVEHEKKDREGELQVTILKPVAETLRAIPQLAGWTVHILND